MKLFKIGQRNTLTEVEPKPYRLEKDIQNLVESNTEVVFGLLFIASELSVDKYRIDTLCYDEENNSLVIIEYKRGSSYSVIDQGYTYLQLLLNNKPHFLLTLSQRFGKVLRLDDLDWSQSRIIFISPSFNSYQRDSVNFKDLPFELWEIKGYSNGTILLNEHRSSSQAKIGSLTPSGSSSPISQVSQEVKVYSTEEHIGVLNKATRSSWEELHNAFNQIDGSELIPKRHYLSLSYNGTIVAYLKFRKTKVTIEIARGNRKPNGEKSKNYFSLDDPKGISEVRTIKFKNGVLRDIYYILFNPKSDLDYVMFLIKQKYKAISL